tara:strand:+ start:923 stop:1348 length:426 start_codon:yes stop_codon:yes gene_type:complete
MWYFSAVYAGIFALVNVLLQGFDVDVGSGVNMAMIFGAAYGSAITFVKDNGRAPDKKESNVLSFYCLLSTYVISLLGTSIIVLLVMPEPDVQELKQLLVSLSPVIWIVIAIVVGVLYFLMLKFVFGWGARKYASTLARRKM